MDFFFLLSHQLQPIFSSLFLSSLRCAACLAFAFPRLSIGCFPTHSPFFADSYSSEKNRQISPFLHVSVDVSFYTSLIVVAAWAVDSLQACPTTSNALKNLVWPFLPTLATYCWCFFRHWEKFIYFFIHTSIHLFSPFHVLEFLLHNLRPRIEWWNGFFLSFISWRLFYFDSALIPTKKWSPTRLSTWPKANISVNCVENIFQVKAACGSIPRLTLENVLLFGEFPSQQLSCLIYYPAFNFQLHM